MARQNVVIDVAKRLIKFATKKPGNAYTTLR